MDVDLRPSGDPDLDQSPAVRRAAVAATLAYSIRGAEPWLLGVGTTTLELFADARRWSRTQDPAGRALTLSVGCALLNARAALDAESLAVEQRLFPDPGQPLHAATLLVHGAGAPGPGNPSGLAHLATHGFERYAVDPAGTRIPAEAELETLGNAVAAEGAVLHRLDADAVLVASAADRAVDWLLAGAALQRLVLEASALGLGTEEVPRLAVPVDLDRLRDTVGDAAHPQAVLRLGAAGRKVRGRRRPLAEILR